MDALATATRAVLRDPLPDQPAWLSSLRRAAAKRFAAQGLPTIAEEQWKYTNVSALASARLRPAGAEDSTALSPAAFAALPLAAHSPWRAVIVNGGFRPDLSRLEGLPAGIRISSIAATAGAEPGLLAASLSAALDDGGSFTALNTALLSDGLVIDIADDTTVAGDLHLVFVGQDRTCGIIRNPRVIVRAGRHSSIRLIEEYVSAGSDAGFTNGISEIDLGAGATVRHHRLQTESGDAAHIGRLAVTAAATSRFESDSLVFGGGLTRVDIEVALGGRGASCRLHGLFVGGGNQHIDHHTRVDHLVSDTHSAELYRGILDEHSRGVFNGKVVVHENAQQITALQTSNNLLLSRHAEIDTKPELEIYADDVRCTHGATVGQLDAAALFYLQSRGIGEAAARALLTYAFAQQIADHIPLDGVRRWIEQRFLGHDTYGELVAAVGAL